MAERYGAENTGIAERVSLYRRNNPAADKWVAGHGPIKHSIET